MKYLTNALREIKGVRVSQYSGFTKIEYDTNYLTFNKLFKLLVDLSVNTECDLRPIVKIIRYTGYTQFTEIEPGIVNTID